MTKRLAVLALAHLTACESDERRAERESIDRINAAAQWSAHAPVPPEPVPLVRPCDRPRPYRDWSNAELNVALVENMGTDASLPLIAEGGCRQAEGRGDDPQP